MRHRYSFLIRPLQLVLDCLIILTVVLFVSDEAYLNPTFLVFTISAWILVSFFTGYYKVYRFTKLLRILNLMFRQFVVFGLTFFAFFGIFREGLVVNNQFKVLLLIFTLNGVLKLCSYYALKIYRNRGKNYRKVVFLGYDDPTRKMISMFTSKSNLGYRYLGFFSDKSLKKKLGTIKESFDFMKSNQIDEVYVSLKELDEKSVRQVSVFTASNDITLKLIPDSDKIFGKGRKVEYYDDAVAVLNVKKLPFEYYENYVVKRLFDIVFSLIASVMVLVMMPFLWIVIKLESRGPLIFKQKREGLNGEKFTCYKFRSMRLNSISDKVHTSKNDERVTKVGKFIRKTSIDELPQFFNVLKGDMSVVGPRPHLESLAEEYQKDVENYLKRHVVKPGITGLAQVSGYRGEIRKKSDIKNRVRLDIFYIENWSFLLDIKIILMTLTNVFKGEDKAY